jgi:hypothetical protein
MSEIENLLFSHSLLHISLIVYCSYYFIVVVRVSLNHRCLIQKVENLSLVLGLAMGTWMLLFALTLDLILL